jgi:hypothetical protein
MHLPDGQSLVCRLSVYEGFALSRQGHVLQETDGHIPSVIMRCNGFALESNQKRKERGYCNPGELHPHGCCIFGEK